MRTIGYPNSARLLSFAFQGKSSVQRGQYDVTHSYGNVIGCDVITAQSCHRSGMEIRRRLKEKALGGRVNFGVADRIRLMIEHENYGKRQYKKVIACSNLVKRELVEHYAVPESDITVIPNGVDIDEFHPRNRNVFREEVRRSSNIGDNELVLLFVGHEFVRKGLGTVIRSIALLKDRMLKLLVCGADHADPFRHLAQSLGVERQVYFLGAQPEVEKYYAASDVFVFPTLHEAFGLVVIEAMASGLPIVVSGTAGAAEDIIEDGKTSLLLSNPQNPEELAAKIQILREDESLRKALGSAARKRVESYTWEASAERVLEVYEQIRHMKSR